jgi:hypothetical protein
MAWFPLGAAFRICDPGTRFGDGMGKWDVDNTGPSYDGLVPDAYHEGHEVEVQRHTLLRPSANLNIMTVVVKKLTRRASAHGVRRSIQRDIRDHRYASGVTRSGCAMCMTNEKSSATANLPSTSITGAWLRWSLAATPERPMC